MVTCVWGEVVRTVRLGGAWTHLRDREEGAGLTSTDGAQGRDEVETVTRGWWGSRWGSGCRRRLHQEIRP